MLTKPALKFSESKRAGFIKSHEESEGVKVIELQPISVHSKECRRYCNCDAFVAIHEGMILGKALSKRGRFLNDVGVITGLRSRQSGFERAQIPDAKRASELFDQSEVDGDHFVQGRI